MSTYAKALDYLLLTLLAWLTIFSVCRLFTIPGLDELQLKTVVVEEVGCTNSGSRSQLLVKAKYFEDSEFKLLKAVRDCTPDKYSYLVGTRGQVLVSTSNRLSIWSLSLEGREIVEYKDTRLIILRESLLALFVPWMILAFVVWSRRRKSS